MSQIYKTDPLNKRNDQTRTLVRGAMIMKLTILLILITAFMAITASAQEPNTAEAKKVEMKKLDKMIGQWKGSGWIQQGPKRETFTGTENVQRKIDGLDPVVGG